MSESVNIHATCVCFGRRGVLLLGKSGSGKSDLALRLIGRDAKLVADDRCDLSIENGLLVARPPATIAGLLEVRGIGIVELPHAPSAPVVLAVDLSGQMVRMPEPARYVPPLALRQSAQPPLIVLNAFEESAPDKIAAVLGLFGKGRRRRAVKRN
ncbi:MAG: HPr kinase/phosphatase C-terminal domain-containing protein [Rhizomicrobium sp.]